jgi:hypothetical protein
MSRIKKASFTDQGAEEKKRRLADASAAKLSTDLGEASVDVGKMILAISMALTLERNVAIQVRIRELASCADDQSLLLQLPIGAAGIALFPDGRVHPLRAANVEDAANLGTLVLRDEALSNQFVTTGKRISAEATAIVLPFFQGGYMPSREEYQKLNRWAPLVEQIAYGFCTKCFTDLDFSRSYILQEMRSTGRNGRKALQRYYSVSHMIGCLTVLASSPEARIWLADMAKSFNWISWTPSFPLMRERTVWLAAAAARSASAFGADIMDQYMHVVSRTTHILKLIDALFGLAAIGLSDSNALPSIVSGITTQLERVPNRVMVGHEFAPVAFRSALNALRRGKDETAPHAGDLAQLSWNQESTQGLCTRAAFRLNPTDIGPSGEMIGFSVLPMILASPRLLHFPLQVKESQRLLPSLKEMPELIHRAWGSGGDTALKTVH